MQQVIQLGLLEFRCYRPVIRKAVHKTREPPRKALGAPYPPQALPGVMVDAGGTSLAEEFDERGRQVSDVRGSQIQALRAGRRNYVRRIASQEQPAEAQRLDHET